MTHRTEVTTDSYTTDDLLYLEELKRRKKILEDEISDIQAKLAKEIDPAATGNVTVVVEDAKTGVRMRATCVRSETISVDLEALRTRNPEAYRAITKTVLDTKAYHRAVNTKVMRNSDIAHTVHFETRAPYFRFSRYGKPVEDEVDREMFGIVDNTKDALPQTTSNEESTA